MAEAKITVKRKELGKVLFDIESGGEVALSNKLLPKDINLGDILVIEVVKEEQSIKRKKDIAKALLDEILNPDEKTPQNGGQKKA